LEGSNIFIYKINSFIFTNFFTGSNPFLSWKICQIKGQNFSICFCKNNLFGWFSISLEYFENFKKNHILQKKSRRLKRVILRMNKLQNFVIQRPLRNYLPKNKKVWYSTEKKDFLQKHFRKYLNFSQISH